MLEQELDDFIRAVVGRSTGVELNTRVITIITFDSC